MAPRSPMTLLQSAVRDSRVPVWVQRFLFPIIAGVLAACLCALWNHTQARLAGDFTWPLRGARLLLHGQDPYHGSLEPLPYLSKDPLFYPLPLVLLFVPLVELPDEIAAGIMFGIITALMVWGLQHARRSAWAFLVSPMFVAALLSTNLSPLVVACYVVPSLMPLCCFKPQFLLAGVVMHAPRTLLRITPALIIVGALVLTSFIIVPTWPLGWVQNIMQSHHPAPASLFGIGWLLLLPVLRFRMPDARFFLAFVCTPQLMLVYDQLPLLLVARTRFETLVLFAGSWLVVVVTVVGFQTFVPWYPQFPFIGIFFPVLCIIMCRRTPVAAAQQPASVDA